MSAPGDPTPGDPTDLFDSLFGGAPARGRGRPSSVALVRGRDLVPDDLESMLDAEGVSGELTLLTRMRHSHHELARLLAEGRTGVEVSGITGKSQSWISTLQRDPAFKDLIEHYRAQKDTAYLDVHARLSVLGADAVAELSHRLDTEPEKLSTREVMELAELALDRSGAGPKAGTPSGARAGGASAGVSLNVTFVSAEPRPSDGPIIDIGPDGRPVGREQGGAS